MPLRRSFANVQLESSSPAEMGHVIRKDIAFWARLLREYKVEPQ